MRLIDGALAIRADLPLSATVTAEVPSGAGSDLGTSVHRLSAIQHVRDSVAVAVAAASGVPVIIGGDCAVDLAGVAHAMAHHDVAVVWLDAHPDLNTPESSPSDAFSGMVLRTLLGEGPDVAVPPTALSPHRVILAGTRASDDPEDAFIRSSSIRMIAAADLTPETVSAALMASGATSVYLHIDLDVIDPGEFLCVGAPEPFGVSLHQLIEAITAARATLPLVGAAVAGFAPASPDSAADDLPTILRIIGALTKGL
ncbi:MAG: hypothetical protein RI885_903 [Actinomycetota bacterium]